MKWLTTFLCLLAMPALAEDKIQSMPEAQDPATQIFPLPFVMQCGPVYPDQMLEKNYQELGFVEGDANIFAPSGQIVSGKLRMFVKPREPRSFTVMIELAPEINCMLTSGSNLMPMVQKDGI